MHNPGIAKRLTLPPGGHSAKLRHALESPRAKLRYPVTLLAHAMRRAAPHSAGPLSGLAAAQQRLIRPPGLKNGGAPIYTPWLRTIREKKDASSSCC